MNLTDACNGCREKSLVELHIYNLRICKNCLLVSRKLEKNFEKKIKSVFQKNRGYVWNHTELEKRAITNYYFFKKLFRFIKIKKNDEILDFGSGFGPLLNILKKKNYKAIGLEPSIKNSRISKKLGHKVINDTLRKNTFNSKKFRIIVSLYVFTYLTDLNQVFKIFRKILKSGGYILLRVHQYKFSKTYWQRNHFKVLGKKATNHFSNNSLKNLFNFYNFDVLLIESNLDGTTIIAKKVKNKKYKKIGNYEFEIFYIKHLMYLISNFLLNVYKLKNKIRSLIF